MSYKIDNEIVIYKTEDGITKINVQFQQDTVWLSLNQMAVLFQRDKSVISRHIRNIYEEGELQEGTTVAFFATVQNEGTRTVERDIAYFNLDVIISVGYRVKSPRGTQFRMWATDRLREYLIKGFALNDDVLKKAGGGDYFDELLDRIRDIRSSEKVFYKKVLNIYSTSMDYDKDAEITKLFFQTVQNKMHWATHGHTAPELITARADANKPFMGLTNFSEGKPKRADVLVAKNYLTEDELQILNRMVSAYLEFAEMQAVRRKPMYMNDWIVKLDDFLRMSEYDILNHAGQINREDAEQTVLAEFEKFRERMKDEPSEVEKHFLKSIEDAAKAVEGKSKWSPRTSLKT